MPRVARTSRFPRTAAEAKDRLRDIDGEIRTILETFPELRGTGTRPEADPPIFVGTASWRVRLAPVVH